MSKRSRDLDDEETDLWRRVTARVKPRRTAKSAIVRQDDKPAKRAAKATLIRETPVERPARAAPKAPPANRGGEKRVRRGKLEIDATLDLHGHTQESGRAALARFLAGAHRRGARTVIVVTGVGRMGQGVLKQMLPEWLAAAPVRNMVSGFAPAHRQHGGAGAYYVFLKQQRRD